MGSDRDPAAPSELPAQSDLPDPLRTLEGDQIDTPEGWWDTRRSEIERLFRSYVYGYAPEAPEIGVSEEKTSAVLDGKATYTELEIRFPDLGQDGPSIDLALFTPPDADSVPTFLGVNRLGNHTVVDDDAVSITRSGKRFGSDSRGTRTDFWCVESVVDRGYGFATFQQADVDPDRDEFTNGVYSRFDRSALPGPRVAAWGTIAAWAWGLQRGVDALRDHRCADPEGIAVIGHSRRGKAALLAGATDRRIAMVVPHQSGTGGCALSRDNHEETVAKINEAFPHWFNDVFPAFGGREERLPVDQHLLIAMVAPRPLLDTEGARDYWANPGRALDAVRAADPVYELLGAEGAVDGGLLHEGDQITPETAGTLLQYRRESGHVLDSGYWNLILDFADCHLGNQ